MDIQVNPARPRAGLCWALHICPRYIFLEILLENRHLTAFSVSRNFGRKQSPRGDALPRKKDLRAGRRGESPRDRAGAGPLVPSAHTPLATRNPHASPQRKHRRHSVAGLCAPHRSLHASAPRSRPIPQTPCTHPGHSTRTDRPTMPSRAAAAAAAAPCRSLDAPQREKGGGRRRSVEAELALGHRRRRGVARAPSSTSRTRFSQRSSAA